MWRASKRTSRRTLSWLLTALLGRPALRSAHASTPWPAHAWPIVAVCVFSMALLPLAAATPVTTVPAVAMPPPAQALNGSNSETETAIWATLIAGPMMEEERSIVSDDGLWDWRGLWKRWPPQARKAYPTCKPPHLFFCCDYNWRRDWQFYSCSRPGMQGRPWIDYLFYKEAKRKPCRDHVFPACCMMKDLVGLGYGCYNASVNNTVSTKGWGVKLGEELMLEEDLERKYNPEFDKKKKERHQKHEHKNHKQKDHHDKKGH